MKIVNVNQNHYVRGGSDSYFFALATLLEATGHSVIPFASAQANNLATPWSRYFPVAVDFDRPSVADMIRFVYSRSAARAMERLVREQVPSIAHLHIYYGQLTGSILAPLARAGVPVVQTLHEYKIVCPTSHLLSQGRVCEACNGSQFWQATIQRCNRGSLARSALSTLETYASHILGALDRVDHFLAVSEFVREKVVSLGVPGHKVTTVHNFVDASRFRPSSMPGEYVLYFGRLERMKGIFTLLDAMSLLPAVRLLVVGDGSERRSMERKILEQGLSNVELLGFRRGADLHDLIRGSICTVLPSECFETFGLTLVESFALGRPVVCTRMGGMTEIVSDGHDGFIVSPGNASELAERLSWMAAHRNAAVAMGARGRMKVERQFSPERHLALVMDVYRRFVPHG